MTFIEKFAAVTTREELQAVFREAAAVVDTLPHDEKVAIVAAYVAAKARVGDA